jgi:hypothetical protein
MMGSFSDYLENKLLDHMTGKTAYTKPTAYLAASTADPTDDASGIAEPSGNGYARVETEGADWNAAASGSVTNANAITFPEASGNWGTISHVALYDASTGGNMLVHGVLDAPQAIASGEVLRVPAGDATLTLA